MKKKYKIKELDLIEMGNNVIQVRNLGKILLFEFEDEKHKKEFYHIIKYLKSFHEVEKIIKEIDLPDHDVKQMIDTLISFNLLELYDNNNHTKIPKEYKKKFKHIFKMFDMGSPATSKESCIFSIYNSTVSVIGINKLSNIVIKKLLEYGFRKINIYKLKNDDIYCLENYIEKYILNKDVIINNIIINKISDIIPEEIGDFVIVPSLTYNKELYEDINEICVKNYINWIPLYFDDTTGYIGPTVIPRKTACLKCLDLRLISNIEDLSSYNAYNEYLKKNKNDDSFINNNLEIIASNFINEFYKVVSGYKYAKTYNSVMEIQLYDNQINYFDILKFPKCPVCSNIEKKVPYDSYAYYIMLSKLFKNYNEKEQELKNKTGKIL